MKVKLSILYISFNVVIFPEIVLGNSSNSTKPDKIKIKLGFVAPLDNRLAATATLGRELDSVFRLAIEVINDRARKEGSKIELETDFSSKNLANLCVEFQQTLSLHENIKS